MSIRYQSIPVLLTLVQLRKNSYLRECANADNYNVRIHTSIDRLVSRIRRCVEMYPHEGEHHLSAVPYFTIELVMQMPEWKLLEKELANDEAVGMRIASLRRWPRDDGSDALCDLTFDLYRIKKAT